MNAPVLIEQGSAAWFDQRLGKVTASRVADAVRRTKKGWAATRPTYMSELLVERITGKVTEHFVTRDMLWGIDTQDRAAAAYAFEFDIDVDRAGFVPHPAINDSGASPDGYVGTDGLVEIKCPTTLTHVETLLGEPIDLDYIAQMQWQMACTRRAWCDFVSFDPRLPLALQMFVQRVPRSSEIIEALERDVMDFLSELRAKEISLCAIGDARQEPAQ